MKALYHFIREPINSLTHGAGAIMGLVFTIVLTFLAVRSHVEWLPFLIFGSSMVLTYLASALYHGLRVSDTALKRWQRIDHSAIFLLIAGTYTPVTWTGLPDPWRWIVLIGIWTVAVGGVLVKTFGFNRLPNWLSVVLYLVMGWFSLALVPQFLSSLPSASMIALVTGGVLYTLGIPFFASRRQGPFPGVFGPHEIWHLFVLGGSIAHFVMIVNLLEV